MYASMDVSRDSWGMCQAFWISPTPTNSPNASVTTLRCVLILYRQYRDRFMQIKYMVMSNMLRVSSINTLGTRKELAYGRNSHCVGIAL